MLKKMNCPKKTEIFPKTMVIEKVAKNDKATVDSVARIHLKTFKGFFLTFMGRGFLKLMYSCYTRNDKSDLLVAKDGEKVVGFCAFSFDISGFYKFMLKTRFIPFVWYAFLAFLRKPKTFSHLIGALFKSKETKREEKYVELASIGVDPDCNRSGVGSELINKLKSLVDFREYSYIALETDAENNDAVNKFYIKNGFAVARRFTKREGRIMNEYRYRNEDLGA